MVSGRYWQGVLQAINAPVILFGLALLSTSTSTVMIIWKGELQTTEAKLLVAAGGASLMLVTIGMVFVLAWFKPRNLMFTAEAHLEEERLRSEGADQTTTRQFITIEPEVEFFGEGQEEGQE